MRKILITLLCGWSIAWAGHSDVKEGDLMFVQGYVTLDPETRDTVIQLIKDDTNPTKTLIRCVKVGSCATYQGWVGISEVGQFVLDGNRIYLPLTVHRFIKGTDEHGFPRMYFEETPVYTFRTFEGGIGA